MIQPLLVFSKWGLLALRLALGAVLIGYGWPKIKNLKATHKNFETMGFKPGFVWGSAIAILEFFGGILIIVGLFTQWVTALLILEFIVAIFFNIRRKAKFAGGYAIDILILASSLVLIATGSGYLALDKFFGILIY